MVTIYEIWKYSGASNFSYILWKSRAQSCPQYALYVQEVVIHFVSNLLYKMGHYLLDTQ